MRFGLIGMMSLLCCSFALLGVKMQDECETSLIKSYNLSYGPRSVKYKKVITNYKDLPREEIKKLLAQAHKDVNRINLKPVTKSTKEQCEE